MEPLGRMFGWCRGPESNWLRPPFQGGALPMSYPGIFRSFLILGALTRRVNSEHYPRRENRPYLSVLKMSATAFHCLSACFFQTTTYLPTVVVTAPLASFCFSSNVPTS
jgi:hypothetical protein